VVTNLIKNPRTPEAVRKRVREATEGRVPKGEERAHTERAALVRQIEALVENTRRSVQALEGKPTSDERQRILDAIETAARTLKAQSQADPEDPDDLEGFFALVLQSGSSVTYSPDHAALEQVASLSRRAARSCRVKRHWNGLAAD
jgi:acyl-CoA reductase-like NAD-dependent aldehyde dehydrogenase